MSSLEALLLERIEEGFQQWRAGIIETSEMRDLFEAYRILTD